jgi:RNA polymerase-binding transcription factor DksA
MITTTMLSPAQRRDLTDELRGERARLQRALADADAAARAIAEERFDAVVDALARLDDGSYGICAACAQPIPYGRLLVMPETRHCVGCGARA